MFSYQQNNHSDEAKELEEFINAAALDTLKELGFMPKEEYGYYNNPANFKKYSRDKV